MLQYIADDGSLVGDGRRCLFMASEVRCGSTYVAETLSYEMHDFFGFELWDLTKELFHDLDDETRPAPLLTRWGALFLDRTGFVASKFMCKSLSYLHRLAHASPAVREAFFGERAYWVVVRRRDRLAQAVSLAAASKSRTYHHYADPELAGDRDVELSLGELDAALKTVALSDIYLQTFADSLPRERVVSLFYEDFLADEIGWINRVHALCGFEPAPADTYRNASKLVRTGQQAKRRAKEQLQEWLLANHA